MPPGVLIAKSNDSFAASGQGFLVRQGLIAERVRQGKDALEKISLSPPDVFLLDLRLPDLPGIEVLKKVHSDPASRDLPIVVSTGVYRGEKYARAARALDARAYLEKPYSSKVLFDTLKKVLPAPQNSSALIDRHLAKVYIDRFSGVCTLGCDGQKWSLTFSQGRPVSIRPGFVHACFGAFWLEKSLVSEEEYLYYKEQAQGRADVFVEMGCLEYGDFIVQQLEYLSGELVNAFCWPPPGLHPSSERSPEGDCGFWGFGGQCASGSSRRVRSFSPSGPGPRLSVSIWRSLRLLGLDLDSACQFYGIDSR